MGGKEQADGRTELRDALIASIARSPIASVLTDPLQEDNPIVAANEAFSALTGYSDEEIIGRNCRFLSGEETDPERRALLRQAIAARSPIVTELVNYRKDGSRFRNALMIAPVLDADGALAFFVGSQMDVTENASSPEEVRRAEAARRVAELTPRQRQVLIHVMNGYRNKQIAAFLGIDEKTVKMHRAAMLAKLGAMTSADAIRMGVEAGLVR